LINYTEVHVLENDSGNFKVIGYLNGRLNSEENLELEFMDNEEFSAELENFTEVLELLGESDSYMRGAVGCLIIGGVGALLAAAAVAACGFFCWNFGWMTLKTAAICISCLGVALPFTGSRLDALARCF